jgi:hypothetical protein
MRTINISHDTADRLIKDILVADYQGLVKSVDSLSARALANDLEPYELQDLANDRTFRDAMAVMLNYYLTHEEYFRILVDTPD